MEKEMKTALHAAYRAGEEIMKWYDEEHVFVSRKEDDSPVTGADIASQQILFEELSGYEYGVLAEEQEDNPERFSKDDVWMIDPLDGTNDFLSKTGEFTVMVGLVKNGAPVLGVVYQPVGDIMYIAEQGKGAFRAKRGTKEKICVSSTSELPKSRFLVSRSHLDEETESFLSEHEIDRVLPVGSSGLKICKIAEGSAEGYLTFTDKTFEWDACAADIILREAGGRITDLDGQLFVYNKKDPRNWNGIIASNGLIHGQLIR